MTIIVEAGGKYLLGYILGLCSRWGILTPLLRFQKKVLVEQNYFIVGSPELE